MTLFEQAGTVISILLSSFLPALANPPGAVRSPEPALVPLAEVAPFPTKREPAIAPLIQAKSAMAVDLPSNASLYEKESDQPVPIASITKLMTALLVAERTKPDDIITVPKHGTTSEESQMGLLEGEQLRADDLMAGLLIQSANDAAVALAEQVAGSQEAFTKQMNERASAMGLRQTRFSNPSGYDKTEDDSYSTARELSVLARASIAEPRIRALVALKEATVKTVGGRDISLNTTNSLLGTYLPIGGLKTGTTDEAGPCLVSWVNSGDRQLLAVVLNSPDRFQESKSILDWSLRSYRW